MKQKYYSVKPLLAHVPDAKYYMIIGERSNGKTYSVLEHGLEEYFKNGSQTGIIRRYAEDFKNKRGGQMYAGLVKNHVITKLSKGEWNGVHYYAKQWFLMYQNPVDPNEKRIDDKPFAYGFALSDMEHDKSISFPDIRVVLFDEFLTRSMYLTDEFVIFTNVLSTIIRDRDNVTVFMCGNTVNKYSPYYIEMGLKHIKNMQKGTYDVYRYGESGLVVAVEYSDFPQKHKKSDIYFAFDNPKLKMITNGEWEIGIYPRLSKDMKYKPKNVLYHYFIIFDETILMCDIVQLESVFFTFIHLKTTPIKDDDTSIIYSIEPSHLRNHHRKINRPVSSLQKRIWRFFLMEKVFYQSNEVGEIVRNYLNWCNNNSIEL